MRCFTVLLLMLFFHSTPGHSQGAIPMTTTIKTPYGNVPHTYYVPSPRYYYGQPNVSAKYEFNIVLKGDSTFSSKTRIDFEDKENQSVTVKTALGKVKLFPKDTKSISRTTFEGKKLIGIPADSCWLFKTESGKINSYSFLAEPGMMYVIAVQDGDSGPIVPLTEENLLDIVGTESPKTYKLIKRKKLIKAVMQYNSEP